ncbi:hypothetical protein [Dictyobacter aurantiacus]|uniref:Uncharacterized protein n=1 Tax=Dictyobacter aurantiacus TaxID=1936993 RepID=A0A401Z843_9CHLR|nr:hypothetical protein [Dictyobacter aurantiacus]GCE03009.1 hypothetical protein KDAU_03380 [Dictyobacter aurantiacus]
MLILISFVFYRLSLSPSPSHSANASIRPTITIDAGFEDTYRSGYWTPVRVTIDNSGPAFQGKLSVQTFSGGAHQQRIDMLSPWSFEEAVTLAQGAQKQLTIYAPHYTGNLITRGFLATLRNERGQTVSIQSSKQGYEVQPGDTLVGVLSDNADLEPQLTRITLINQSGSLNVSRLDAHTMPTIETALENFDVLILDNFATNTLSTQQLAMLQTWVNRGGTLIEVGGLNWQRTLSSLPAHLLPVDVHGLDLLPAGTHLQSFNGNTIVPVTSDIPPSQPTISTARLARQEVFSNVQTVLSSAQTPLIVQAHQGSGAIYYLAFDPAAPPLDSWNTSANIWQMIIQRALGDRLLISSGAQSYDDGPGQILTRGGLVSFLNPGMSSTTNVLLFLLIGYLLFLGPVRMWYIRKRPAAQMYNGRIVLSSVLVFSVLTFGMAGYEKEAGVTNNSVSMLQINQDGTAGHITTYMSVLAPNQGDLHMQIPGENLSEPIDIQYLDHNSAISTSQMPPGGIPTKVTYNPDNTSLALSNSNLWSVDPIVSEQDLQLQGQLSGYLTVRDNHVLGSVQNNLHTALSDAYILLPHTFITLGHIDAGQTRNFDVQLHATRPVSEQTLADQIAHQVGLPGQYFPFLQKAQPQTELQKHMALLSALSGVGYNYTACEGSCMTHAITGKNTIYVTGGQIPDPNLKNDYDPLLIPDAQATFIAWADQSLSGQPLPTVNDQTPQGQHTMFVQMPMKIHYSGLVTIPQDSVTGNVVDIASFDAGAILPGSYTLTSGNVKFELDLPDVPRLYIGGLTITIPNLITHPSGPGSGITTYNNNITAKIYNWYTQKWERMQTNANDAFTTNQPATYTGPNGRILVQVGSKKATQIYFGKPTLSINGNAIP